MQGEEHMKTTIDMAREAGAIHIHGKPKEFAIVGNDSIKAFEALVRADERAKLQPKKIKAVKDEYCHGDERYYANE
jgi:hypothetical protein